MGATRTRMVPAHTVWLGDRIVDGRRVLHVGARIPFTVLGARCIEFVDARFRSLVVEADDLVKIKVDD